MNIIQKQKSWSLSRILIWGLMLSVLTLTGCGGAKTHVTGKVTVRGEKVTSGSVSFLPIGEGGSSFPGKPVAGLVRADGTYVLGNNGSDAAVIGRHRIAFLPPAVETPALKPGEMPPQSPLTNHAPNPNEVEVKAGNNVFDIELVPQAGR